MNRQETESAVKNLASWNTKSKFVAKLVPVGKETDRRWEQGEDPSMLEPGIHVLESKSKMCVADASERKRWSKIGIRKLMRDSGFSQTTVYQILEGEPVRCYILSSFKQAADKTIV